ncbi:MAG TPA: hypothetical protein VIM41_07040, partial [Gammaproteobacteria bacterium]
SVQEFPFLECNYSPVGGAGVSCRGTPQVRPCRLLWAIPGPTPCGRTACDRIRSRRIRRLRPSLAADAPGRRHQHRFNLCCTRGE